MSLRRFVFASALIAGLLTLFDFIAHQSPIPFAVVEEPLPYYALKFLAFFAASMFAFLSSIADRPFLGPLFIGALGAIIVGAAYFYVQFVPLGQRTIGGQLLWGALHYGFGYLSAALVLRRPIGILYAIVVIVAVIIAGFVFQGAIAASPPAVGPGY